MKKKAETEQERQKYRAFSFNSSFVKTSNSTVAGDKLAR